MQDRVAVGIDFSGSNARVAYVNESGMPEVISNANGELKTPTIILFESTKSLVVGREAQNSARIYPDLVVASPQRYLGNPSWVFSVENQSYSAEEICTYMIRSILADASAQINQLITDVTIACPNYFGVLERNALSRAVRLAGINTVNVISASASAALSYGTDAEGESLVLIYDLGGESFNVGLARITDVEIKLLAYRGAGDFGGREWDARLVTFLAQEWMREKDSIHDPTNSFDSLQDLWIRAEEAKKALSVRTETRVPVSHAGIVAPATVTREKFDELTAGLLEQTVLLSHYVLDEARLQGSDRCDEVLLVGGATRMPQVATRLEREFGKVVRLHEPELITAKGAAIWTRRLLNEQQTGSPAPAGSEVIPANVFISYNRSARPTIGALAERLAREGHHVWFDQHLIGGQVWWDEILQHIGASDLFLFMLTPASLNSIAYQREYQYAHTLRKYIVPVLLADDVDLRLLPSSLQAIQVVDYRTGDAAAWQQLSLAIRQLPPPLPMPNPLSPPPAAPISPLGTIRERLSASTLSLEEQVTILHQLRGLLRDEDTADGARILLREMDRHLDLRASIADEIRQLLG